MFIYWCDYLFYVLIIVAHIDNCLHSGIFSYPWDDNVRSISYTFCYTIFVVDVKYSRCFIKFWLSNGRKDLILEDVLGFHWIGSTYECNLRHLGYFIMKIRRKKILSRSDKRVLCCRNVLQSIVNMFLYDSLGVGCFRDMHRKYHRCLYCCGGVIM